MGTTMLEKLLASELKPRSPSIKLICTEIFVSSSNPIFWNITKYLVLGIIYMKDKKKKNLYEKVKSTRQEDLNLR